MKLQEYFAQGRGRCARVAAAVGVAPAYMSQMANGVRPVPPGLVPAIVAECGGEVSHWDIREDWFRIWPQLIGAPGAPSRPAGVRPDPLTAADAPAAAEDRRTVADSGWGQLGGRRDDDHKKINGPNNGDTEDTVEAISLLTGGTKPVRDEPREPFDPESAEIEAGQALQRQIDRIYRGTTRSEGSNGADRPKGQVSDKPKRERRG